MAVPPIRTDRLELVSPPPQFIDAVLAGRREEAERLAALRLSADWPDEHDARCLGLRLGQLRANPDWQEWLVRVMVLRTAERALISRIGFHGPPGVIGRAELGYTVRSPFRRRGYALEAAPSDDGMGANPSRRRALLPFDLPQ